MELRRLSAVAAAAAAALTVASVALLLPTSAAAASDAPNPVDIRQVLEAAMRCQSVRQLHAAVVHKDRELFSMRLELLPSGQVVNITESKLLYLASVSKGMFGTALVRVEQHLRTVLKNQSFSLFNTPIKQLLGGSDDFWFLDHGRTELVTIDDLLSHRTGLARHDVMWYLHDWPNKQEFIKQASRLNASADFRNSFLYNNIVWTLADIVVQRLADRATFVDYMREFLWRPLGMTDTHGSSELLHSAALHSRVDTKRHCTAMGTPVDASKMEIATQFVEAAGGILSSLDDMMKYMRLHTSWNYSAYEPVPGQFRPLNALVAEAGMNGMFTKQIYNDDVTNLPEWDIESYGRGWMRTWHNSHLDFSHGGSLLGVRCELDVFPRQHLAVFNHLTLGPTNSPLYQAILSSIINKYIADLMLGNASFVTKDNVCSLLRNESASTIARLPRKQLTGDEISALSGSYGNYGLGRVELTYNQTARTMTMVYGIATIELIPVVLQSEQPGQFYFFMNLLQPAELSNQGALVNRTDDAIFVPSAALQTSQAFAIVRRDAGKGTTELQADGLDPGTRLLRGLDPGTWTRPKLCPENSAATAVATAASVAMAAAASVLLR